MDNDKNFARKTIFVSVAAAFVAAGCATIDPNYALAVKAYADAQTAQAAAAKTREEAQMDLARSIEEVAKTGSEAVKAQAIMALAMLRTGTTPMQLPPQHPPAPPESAADKALRVVGMLAPLAVQAYGIAANKATAITQAQTSAQVQMHAQTTNAQMFRDAGAANQAIAGAGFGATAALGTAGFNTISALGGSGFQSIATIVESLGRPFNVSGNGVVVTGTNNGNAGTNNRQGSTTVTCPATAGNAGNGGTGAAGSGGNGSMSTTGTGAAGGSGGSGPGGPGGNAGDAAANCSS